MIPAKKRFKNLEIWRESIELAKDFCCIAEKLKKLHLDKLSEYIGNICIRISNNIAEISENHSEKSITRFLTNAHLLTLEGENIIMILSQQNLVDSESMERLLQKLDCLDKKIKNVLSALSGLNQFSV